MNRYDVAYWHFADKPTAPGFVAYWTNNGQRRILARVGYDVNDPKRPLGRDDSGPTRCPSCLGNVLDSHSVPMQRAVLAGFDP